MLTIAVQLLPLTELLYLSLHMLSAVQNNKQTLVECDHGVKPCCHDLDSKICSSRRLEDRQFVDNGVGIKDRGISPIGRLIVMHSLHFYVYAVYAYNTTST